MFTFGFTVPGVKVILATRFENIGVEFFSPLGVPSNEWIPVSDGMPTIVPGYSDVYKQIAMGNARLSFYSAYDRIRIELVPQNIESIRYRTRNEMKCYVQELS